MIRRHMRRLPGTSISWPHISAIFVQPNSLRATTAGNSALRSVVVVKLALATSWVEILFVLMISLRSSRVASRIASRVLDSTVVAPRMPRTGIKSIVIPSRSGGQPLTPAGASSFAATGEHLDILAHSLRSAGRRCIANQLHNGGADRRPVRHSGQRFDVFAAGYAESYRQR